MSGPSRSTVSSSPDISSFNWNKEHNWSGTQDMRDYIFSSYYQHSRPVAVAFIFAYIVIFLLCMIGNTIVCFIVLKKRQMRTVTNIFILNLAISDLLVGIFCLPITLVDNLITGWPFDIVICKMSGLVQGASVSASVFTLVAIAVERFRCIVYPFQRKPTRKQAYVTIMLIWTLAITIMCPSAVTLTVSRDEYHIMVDNHNNTYPLYICWEAWPNQDLRKLYTTVLFSHIYFAPVTLMIITYARIALKLFRSAASIRDVHVEDNRHRVSRRKVRVINMLVFMVLLFTVSWLPLWTLMLLTDYGKLTATQLDLVTVYIFPFAHWLAFFNSSVNPIIYGYFNENFRHGFKAAFKFQLCSLETQNNQRASERRPNTKAGDRIFEKVQPHGFAGQKHRRRKGIHGENKGNELVLEELD